LATVTCDAGAELEGCNTMKCDDIGAWIFHECADPEARREGNFTDSSSCYGSAIDVGGNSIKPTEGDGDSTDDRANAQATKHSINAPGKKADTTELVTTTGEGEGGKANIVAFILAI